MVESNIASFEQDVVEASMHTPVLVDFWAPWCGPCRVLGPMLEKLEHEYAGRFKLVKVDSDQNPELSQAFRIRSIPYVVAFVGGRPVDQFLGALPEGQLRAFIDRLVPNPSQLEHARAQQRLDEGDADGALEALKTALALDPSNDDARIDLIGVLLDRHEIGAAKAQFELLAAKSKADPELKPHIDALTTRLAALEQHTQQPSSPALEARVAANPADLEARLELANLYIAHKAYEAALAQLLEIVSRDRAFQDDIGRKTMIQVFDLASSDAQLVGRYRRLLATAVLK